MTWLAAHNERTKGATTMTDRNRWHLIGRGFAGWYAVGERCRSSGGTLDGYTAEARSGALVYDAEHLERDPQTAGAFVKHVIGGPLLAPELPAGHIRRMLTTDPVPCDPADPPHSLDYVATDIMEGLIRALPGVRIGRIVGQGGGRAVRWESEADGGAL
jgi:hypothetical protein